MAACAGSTAQISISGLASFNTFPMPVIVPPVPMPEQKPSIGPSACARISFAVCRRCACTFSGFSNWFGTKTRGSSSFICCAFAMHFSMHSPILNSSWIRISSAPYWRIKRRRSRLTESGMMIMTLYPFTAPTSASPIPWLPLVGSTMMESGFKMPASSAARIIWSAVRVLIDPPTFRPSYLTRTSASSGPVIRLRRISGVLPTASNTF